MKLVLLILVQVFYAYCSSVYGQQNDSLSAIFFEQESVKKPIVFKDGRQVTFWYGAGNTQLFGKLKILSDSTISIGSDSIHIKDINAIPYKRKLLVAFGGGFMLFGGASSGLGGLLLNYSNKKIEEDLANIILYFFPALIGGGMLIAGPIITTSGIVMTAIGHSKKLKIQKRPQIKIIASA